MSAYIASPPVTARNTAPNTAKVTGSGVAAKNRTARTGSSASSAAGWRRIAATPSTAIAPNQTSMTGPKIRPMKPVPRDWTKNSPIRIATVIGRTSGVSDGASTFSPSTALSTDIAGVIAPSPYSKAAPTRPSTSNAACRVRGLASRAPSSASIATTPPSP